MSNQVFTGDPVRAACQSYLDRGFSIVHWSVTPTEMVAGSGKGPKTQNWQANDYLVPPEGCGHLQVGLKAGAAIKPGPESILGDQPQTQDTVYLAIVDIDDPALQAQAEVILPQTGLIGGKESTPRSHFFYATNGPCNSFSWSGARGDGTKGATIELFGVAKKGTVGHQVVVAPSIHFKSGLRYVWDQKNNVSVVECDELFKACEKLAKSVPQYEIAKGKGLRPRWTPEETVADVAAQLGGAIFAAAPVGPGGARDAQEDKDAEDVEKMAEMIAATGQVPEAASKLEPEEVELLISDAVLQAKRLEPGSRQAGLNRLAFTAGSRLAGGGAPDEAYESLRVRLIDAAESLPPPDVNMRVWTDTIFRSVAEGRRSPRRKSRIENFKLSAQGLTDLLVEMWEPTYRYVIEHKRWHAWNGIYWEPVSRENVLRDMVYILRWAQVEAVRCKNKAFAKAALKWYFKLESGDAAAKAEMFLRASMKGAGGQLGLGIHAEELDTDQWLVCAANGYFDIRTGTLSEPDRNALVTRHAPYNYIKGATSKMFDERLKWVFEEEPDAEIAKEYFASWLGYCITGCIRQQSLLVLYGNGRNGKTTCLDAVSIVTGTYAVNLAKEVLISVNSNSTNTDGVAELAGKRWGFYSESEPTAFLSEGRVKMLTGGHKVRAMRKYESAFDFLVTTKLVLDTNYKPRVNGCDLGILRRLKFLPFKRTVDIDKVDKLWLTNIIKNEGNGLLSYILDKAHEYYERGELAKEPQCVVEAFEEYKEANDHFGTFLRECCNTVGNDEVGGPGGKPRVATDLAAGSGELYRAYHQWSRDNGLFPVSSKVFRPKLEEKGFFAKRVATGVVFAGIELRTSTLSLAPAPK